MHEVLQWPSERQSLEVDLFRRNGFESYCKFTLEKKDWHTCMLCQEKREISLTVLLVNCHEVPPIEFWTGEKMKQLWKVLLNGITNQKKVIKNF